MNRSKEVPIFSSDEPVTPYQKAAQVWDERVGTAWQQLAAWRLACYGLVVLALLLTTIIIVLVDKAEVKPYVIEMEKGGRVVNVAPVTEIYHPNNAQVHYFLSEFVTTLFAVPIDGVVMRKDWENLYRRTTEAGAALLTQYIQTNRPFDDLDKKRASVNVENIVHRQGNSYQVEWTVKTFDQAGKLAETRQLSGLFIIVIRTPATVEQISSNPLGIFVHNFQISPNNDWGK